MAQFDKEQPKQDNSNSGITTGDHLVHALLAGGQVRALAAVTTNLVEEARWRHDLSPTATAALGRTLTVGGLMGAMLKHPQRIFLDLVGDGPLRYVRVNADAEGNVRGYVGDPHVDLPAKNGKLDVGGAVGQGDLYVLRDFGLKETYRGHVRLVSGEIGEDFSHYFLHSEQTPSVVSVGVLVGKDRKTLSAGGLILQVLPGADEAVIDHLEQAARQLPAVSSAVHEGQRAEDLIRMAANELDVKLLEERPVQFHCGCSRPRFEKALIALGADELTDMMETDGSAELVCHFCSEVYRFDGDELRALLAEATEAPH